MTMHFFKKVMTFFSAIWNAILWRKINKKPKQVAKSAKEENQTEHDLNPITGAENQFVDVPLYSLEGNDSSEQELVIRDEIPVTLAPIVAHNIECRVDAERIKEYSSGVQLFGFEDETDRSLSFFSEPIRGDKEAETPLLPSKDENVQLGLEENADSGADKIDSEALLGEEEIHSEMEDAQQVSEELPTPPNEPIPELALLSPNDVSEIILTEALEASPTSGNVLNAGLETQLTTEDFESSSSNNHICIIQRSRINTDLNYLAIGDEIHLFDHDGIIDTFPIEIEENEISERPQAIETDMLVEESKPRSSTSLETSNDVKIEENIATSSSEMIPIGQVLESTVTLETVSKDVGIDHNTAPISEGVPISISAHKSITKLETAEAISEDVEIYQNAAISSTEFGPIGVSVSSSQAIPDTNEGAIDISSKYSTNYMVKSDSLVNFLPEDGSDPDMDDVANITEAVLETSKKSMPLEEERAIILSYIPLLKEGGLEELMCTTRGVLKLSGDHHIDCTDGNYGTINVCKESHEKTTVDDFLIDTFLVEEPLLKTHHLEGCILKEPSLECAITEDSPTFRELLGTVESGLEDSEKVDFDELGLEEHDTENDATGMCRSLIKDDPASPFISNRCRKYPQDDSQKLNQDKNEEDRKSPCRLRQFMTFHSDDEHDCKGHSNRNDLLVPGMPTLRSGEVPVRSGSSDFVPIEEETSPPLLVHEEESNAGHIYTMDSLNTAAFHDGPGWRRTLSTTKSEEVTKIHGLNPTISLPFLKNLDSPMLGMNEYARDIPVVGKTPHSQIGDDNDFHPFIDCPYLFRIPEEIRRETSFNPCVGAAPSQRSGYTNDDVESARVHGERDGYEKYPNMVPNCVGPLINPCIPQEYRNSDGMAKLPDGCDYNQRPVLQNVGTFWGANPGIVHHPRDQQHAILGYPVNCTDNYYEEEDLNVITTATEYENDESNICINPEGFGYMNPYGTEFPLLGIPFCTPQSQSVFVPRGPSAPIIFPIVPISQTENLPSLIDPPTPAQNEQYPIPHSLWGGYPTTAHLQNDEDYEEKMASVIEVRAMVPIENISTVGTNDDDDDIENNPIPDPYFQLTENNSLHTVRSIADSYTSSLFCESVRSIISHNVESENIFPSFSCSSVRGCGPSVLMQSCETTLSNDSLPSMIVEETNFSSKSGDEDYLATEKFMNDVNTALNESVLDQLQGRVDLHCNLLGRGDGSLPIEPVQSEHDVHLETSENDDMLRNSLGENISINNSKLTLLDGVLRTGSGGSLPNAMLNLTSDGESSNLIIDYCREILDSLVEDFFTALDNQTTTEVNGEIAPETNADCGEDLDDSILQANPTRDLIVQNMIVIEGVPDQVTRMWREGLKGKQQSIEKNAEKLSTEKVVNASIDENDEKASNNFVETDTSEAFAVDDIPNRKGGRNRRRRKRLSEDESKLELPCVSGITIGDGISATQGQFTESYCDKFENEHLGTSEPEEVHIQNDSKPKSDGELFPNESARESAEREDVARVYEEGDGLQEEEGEPGENSGNTSSRRRRNRRRKRKN